MNIKKVYTVLFLFIICINILYAQDQNFPYELKNQDLLLIPLGTGLSIWSEYLSGQTDHPDIYKIETLKRKKINGFDRCATYNWSSRWADRSDLSRNILIFSALLSSVPSAFQGKFYHSITLGTMMAESLILLRNVTYLIKIITHRKRPYLYNTALSAEKRYEFYKEHTSFSFYSGHTSVAFLAATFLSKVVTDIHGVSIETKILWGASLTAAALTGYARVKAGMHYPTDVITGAVIGSAAGYLVTTLHRKSRENRIGINVSPHHINFFLNF